MSDAVAVRSLKKMVGKIMLREATGRASSADVIATLLVACDGAEEIGETATAELWRRDAQQWAVH